jgi:hypothetical protein
MKPYEIWIGGYNHMSAGVRALHVLKDELVARDIPAWMRYEPRQESEFIGVYPEIVADNPESYQQYARWKLNTIDLPDDAPIYAWEEGMGNHPLLTVNVIEMDLWRPYTGNRSGVAYWVGKGIEDPQWIPDGAEHISRNNYTTREALAERVRSLDYLISFDPFTALTAEAAMSGTPVLVRGEHHTMSQEDLKKHSWTMYGVAWDLNEMERARETVRLAYDHYESLLPQFAQRIDDFIQYTQKVFN